jgi:hypothetical protein
MTTPANYADPTVFGPIFWKSIHSKARNAQSPEQQKQYITYFRKKLQSIPCETCRTRALEYLQLNPIEHAPPARGPLGAEATMFRYTWEFHNLVNSHLDKPLMSWDQACFSTPITGHLDLSETLSNKPTTYSASLNPSRSILPTMLQSANIQPPASVPSVSVPSVSVPSVSVPSVSVPSVSVPKSGCPCQNKPPTSTNPTATTSPLIKSYQHQKKSDSKKRKHKHKHKHY